MPCLCCGARQTDPARGASPWARGVAHGTAVLVCPDCQRRPGWTERLDRCPHCGDTRLGRRLGETWCRGCGWSGAAAAAPPEDGAATGVAGLAAEVAAAVERVLRGGPPT